MTRFAPSVRGGWWCTDCGSTIARIGMVYACLLCSGCYGLYDEPLVTFTEGAQPACGEWPAEDVTDAGTDPVVDSEPQEQLK